MNKNITVITGKQESGKSFLTRNIALGYDSPVFLYCRNLQEMKDPFLFRNVNSSTDLIVFDDVPPNLVQYMVCSFHSTLLIQDRGVIKFKIPTPKIIITSTDFSWKDFDPILSRSIYVIDTSIEYTDNGTKLFRSKKIN